MAFFATLSSYTIPYNPNETLFLALIHQVLRSQIQEHSLLQSKYQLELPELREQRFSIPRAGNRCRCTSPVVLCAKRSYVLDQIEGALKDIHNLNLVDLSTASKDFMAYVIILQ